MKLLRESSEEEMLLSFLRGELASDRFSKDLIAALEACHAEPSLITDGDLASARENALRREVMGVFRGYGRDEELFQHYPAHVAWRYAEAEAGDLAHIRYIDYSYWNELSRGTSSPLDAVRTIREDRWIFEVPNDRLLAGERHLRAGGSFPPLILLTSGSGQYVIVEGHLRATAYALAPEYFAGTHCYVGTCSQAELKVWNGGYE